MDAGLKQIDGDGKGLGDGFGGHVRSSRDKVAANDDGQW